MGTQQSFKGATEDVTPLEKNNLNLELKGNIIKSRVNDNNHHYFYSMFSLIVERNNL